jgi:hypothetical protein
MKSLLTLLFIAVLVYSAYQLWSGFQAAEGTAWQRLVTTFRSSSTLAVAFVVRVADSLAGSLDGIAGWLNMPEAQAVIQRYLTPEMAMLLMLGVAIATEIARRRTLAKAS